MQRRRIMETDAVAARFCLLIILAAGFIGSGVVALTSISAVRFRQQRHGNNHHRGCQSITTTALFGRIATHESIIASNREYLINVLGVSPNRIKTIETRRATKLQGGILALEIGVLEERVAWLMKNLNLGEDECKKMIQRDPIVLCLQPATLTPKLDYLRRELCLDERSLQKLVMRFPAIFGYRIEDNIEPKLAWLRQRLNLDEAQVGIMIQRCPQILGSSTSETLEPTLQWIQSRFSLSDDELSNLIQKLPTLFGCSVANNLEPTLNFYIDALGGDEDKASGLVMKDPGIFTSSLEKRLKPRLEEARDAGLIIDARRLQRIAKYTEKQWTTSLDYQRKKCCAL
mmetsp:Transcript_3493/g.8894  ORF Transcript_3493/g.8894 Transcript_3493/m.8894 type:complete len:344 (-) Transcript_3493:135-1166(-)